RTWIVGVVTGFLVFESFVAGLQHAVQSASAERNAISSEHNANHIKSNEEAVKELRQYVDERDNATRASMFSKDEHGIFDKERASQLTRIEDRLQFLERQCGQKK